MIFSGSRRSAYAWAFLSIAGEASASAGELRPRQNNATSTSTIYVTVGGANNTGALPSTGTGSAYASACNAAKQSWLESAESWSAVSTSVTTFPTYSISKSFIDRSTTTTSLVNSTAYTLCDGYPRLDGSTSVSSWVETKNFTDPYTASITSIVSSPVNAPSCIIASSDCATMNSSWYSADQSWSTAFDSWYTEYSSVLYSGNTATIPPRPTYPGYSPVCGNSYPLPTSTVGDPTCFEPQASVRLLYWPVEADASDICNKNRSTTTFSETIPGSPNTVVTFNTTLTSPTVYVQVLGQWRYTSSGTTMTNQTQFLIPQQPTAVRSLCATISGHFGSPQPVDYANFNYPVPASAYRCQPKCYPSSISDYQYTTMAYSGTSIITAQGVTEIYFNNTCSTIWDDYAPALSVPQEFFSLAPATELGESMTCDFIVNSDNVFFDPPIALQTATSEDGPSMPGYNSATSTTVSPSFTAEPASTIASTTPKETNTPPKQTTAGPSRPEQTQQTTAQPQSTADSETDQTPTQAGSEGGHSGGSSEGSLAATGAQGNSAADPQSSQNPDPAGSTKSAAASVGNVIASVLGMSKGDSSAVVGSAGYDIPSKTDTAAADPVASTDLVDPITASVTSNDPTGGYSTGIVLGGAGGAPITAYAAPSGGLVIGSTTIPYGSSVSISGVGQVVADSTAVAVSGSTVAYSALSAGGIADGQSAGGATTQSGTGASATTGSSSGGSSQATAAQASTAAASTERPLSLVAVVAALGVAVQLFMLTL